MRKQGKYEKAAPPPAQKQDKGLKDPILQTYMTSLLSLVLCCTMFFGTTMAWFTDEVTVTGNQIHVGTLSAKLALVGKEKTTTELEHNKKQDIFPDMDKPFLPGDERSTTLQVANTGEMDFDYRIKLAVDPAQSKLRDGTVMTMTQALALAEHVTVTVDEKEAGNLKEILEADDALVSGKLMAKNEATIDAKQFSVGLKLDLNTPSEFMGQILYLNVRMVAYQQSDAVTVVTSEKELAEALTKVNHIAVADDVKITAPLTISGTRTISLDGGNLICAIEKKEGEDKPAYAFTMDNGASLTINGNSGKINANSGLIHIPEGVSATVKLDGGTYTNSTGWVILCEGKGDLTVDGSKLNSDHGIHTGKTGTVVIRDSSITANNGLAVEAVSSTGVLMENCTVNTWPPTSDEALKDANRYFNAVAVSGGGKLTLKGCTLNPGTGMKAIAILSTGGSVDMQGTSGSGLVQYSKNSDASFQWSGNTETVQKY